MTFKNCILPILIILFLSSCSNTKYHYYFETRSIVDFTEGEWILNKSKTNYNQERIDKIAQKQFKKILGDSLVLFSEVSQGKILPAQLSFDPSAENLLDLKRATGKDYLINVQSNMIKNETSAFPSTPAVGSAHKTNEAGIKIKIYDLNTLSLLSEGSVTGISSVTRTAGEKGISLTNNAQTLSMQGLIKLIKRYKKNGKTN